MKKIVVAIVFLMVLLSLVLFFVNNNRNRLSISPPLATNIQFPYLISSDKLRFFSGSAFAELDTNTFQTKGLTPFYRLPEINTVRWGSNAVLFSARNYTLSDQLYGKLVKQGLPTDGNYWWLINFKNNEISLVGGLRAGGVSDAIWLSDEDRFIVVVSGSSDANEVFINQINGEQTKLFEVPGIQSLLWANSDRLILSSLENSSNLLVQYRFQENQKQILAEKIGPAVVNNSGERVLFLGDEAAVEGTDELFGNLELLDVTSGTVSRVANRFSGTLAWSPNGQTWLALSHQLQEDSLIGDVLGNKDQIALDDTEFDPSALVAVSPADSEKFYMIDQNKFDLYLASKVAPEALPALPDFSAIQEAHFGERFYLSFNPQQNRYNILILTNPFDVGQNQAITYIKSRQFDPYQLNLRFVADDGVVAPN